MMLVRLLVIYCALGVAYSVATEVEPDNSPLIIGIPDIIRDAIPSSALSSALVSVRTAYRSVGKEIKLFHAPVKRLAFMTERNALDAEFIRTSYYDDLHTNMLKVPVPIFSGGVYAISLAKNTVATENIQFDELVLGCLRGVLLTDVYCKKGKSTIEASSVKQLVQLLEKKRIQIMIVFSGVIHEPALNNKALLVHEPPLKEFSGYHFINQKHIELLPVLTDAFKREFSKTD